MTQIKDDCFAFGGKLMSLAEALALVDQRVTAVAGRETLGLRTAHRRFLAEDLTSAVDVPPFTNAAVDGYAFASTDLESGASTRLRIRGRAAAGHPAAGPCAPGEAVRVFTGAVLPERCDSVVMQEDVEIDGAEVVVPPGLKRGANRRRAGEDVHMGDRVLAAGTRLRAEHVALAAACGRDRLAVYRPLRVALFSTGDELREPGADLPPGAIHDANRYMLMGLLADLGCAVNDLGILPDSAAAVRAALREAAAGHDVVFTSGGVSTGEEDHVRAAVEAQGRLHFWRLAIKPGRPLALGQLGDAIFIGLPGNPVAVMVCFLRFARPILLRLAGARDTLPTLYRVRADFTHEKRLDRREFVRARLVAGGDGQFVARKFERQGSGLITSLVASDGLVELGEDITHLERGAMVDFLPFREAAA